MPIDPASYPANWRDFSNWVRFVRASYTCECTGQCGLHQPNPNPRRCMEYHHRRSLYARGTIHLTTAHLCACHPPCAIPGHVIAACQRCHLRIDRKLHAANRKKTLASRHLLALPSNPHATILLEPPKRRNP
jgi:hypothetical protein